ncbi:YtxH domain-containing protein [Mucilaginibacter sp. PAMB04274]|uniref:YtxH domain-containing protein n=1 Tax=Mucilaginibacter sp. PAMB04274 TaxID=3138568 RepID=UPI0031F5FDB2
MKNPLEKDHNNLVIPILLGAAAVAAVTYLFVTESGSEVRGRIADNLNKGWDTLKEKIPAEEISAFKDKVSDTVSTAVKSVTDKVAGEAPQEV